MSTQSAAFSSSNPPIIFVIQSAARGELASQAQAKDPEKA